MQITNDVVAEPRIFYSKAIGEIGYATSFVEPLKKAALAQPAFDPSFIGAMVHLFVSRGIELRPHILAQHREYDENHRIGFLCSPRCATFFDSPTANVYPTCVVVSAPAD
jgi:hypothetical protein